MPDLPEQPNPRKSKTAKTLGGRYDLNYFKRPTRMNRWRLGISVALLAAAFVWLSSDLAVRRQTLYSPGSVSSAHSFFADRCEVCHATFVNGVRKRGVFHAASNQACLSCHDAPNHHPQGQQPDAPACSSCHEEHEGPTRLARVQDHQCLNCHAHLDRKKGDTLVVANISGFRGKQHPEFSVLRKRMENPPAIVFHHAAHLGKSLKSLRQDSLKQDSVNLDCADCHRPAAAKDRYEWKYRQIDLANETEPPLDPSHRLRPDFARELMSMPAYEKQCAGCHELKFDSQVTDSLKHPETQKDALALPGILRQKFQDYIRRHPEELHKPVESMIPEKSGAMLPSDANSWVEYKVARAEQFLAQNTCRYCHVLEPNQSSAGVPVVKKAGFEPRQMADALFSHESHISVTCESCHAYPRDGDLQAVEKLLPGIATCQACHNGNPALEGKGENGCYLCHQYHPWDPQRAAFRSKYTIEELTGPHSWRTHEREKGH